MTLPRFSHAAGMAVKMRTPLARAELAASRLAREGTTPTSRSLASGVSEAVDEIDALISRLLEVLLPPAGSGEAATDVASAVSKLRERHGAILAARGVVWEEESAHSGALVRASVPAERMLLALLRAAAMIAGRGGRFGLSCVRESDRIGVALRCREPADSDGFGSALEVLDEVRSLALVHGGGLEWCPVESGVEARLWLPGETQSCPAS